MSSRMDSLIGDDYAIQRFADLSIPYQMAIVWFKAVDGQAWDGVDLSSFAPEDLKDALMQRLSQYVALYGDTLVGTAFPSTADVRDSVMRDPDISEDFSSWEDYQSFYLAGGVPTYPESDRWPVILSNDAMETLRDGWHRFHSYVRDGATAIPAIFFPEDRHLSN